MNIDDYRQMRERLSSILESLPFLTCNVPQPPLLDMDGGSTFGGGHNEVVGIKNFKISAERDIEVLDTYISQHSNTTGPLPPLSTNAPYILAVWSEIIAASPVHAVGKTFNLPKEKGRGKDAGSVKVDVVADEGRQWIRVNTIKNSRLMAEIHELDGYESESSESSLPASGNIVTQSHENSILRMAKALLAAAKHHTVPDTGETPRVMIRLTRLEVDPTSSSNEPIDSRIARTIQYLETLSVDVQLGERPFPPRLLASSAPSPTPPRPTLSVNLDLSLIIALVSDLSHAPLPLTEDGAQERFRPLTRVWKSGKLLRSSIITNPSSDEDADTNDDQPTEDGEDVVKDSHEHSRALALQLLSEMRHSLLDEMASYLKPEHDQPPLEFWTTPEAQQRCMKIVDKIGGVGERRRAQALFEPSGEAAFWQDSRFSMGFIPGLVPVRIYPQNVPAIPTLDITKTATSSEIFARRLFRTCRILLFPSQARTVQGAPTEIGYATELTPPLASASQSIDTGTPSPSVLAGSRPNTRLTAHTVRSMLWGAARRVTTLTANRASVRAVLREMKVLAGVGMDSESDRTNDVELDAGRGEDQSGHEVGDEGVAVLWIVEPRSLAEQMRSDVVNTRV
ncbi:hypothetical protein FRC09_011518 [Ceratobasidium sp. 395]|nr:hypothetical protein FRC09_011518 [Ceratobasidium sp. 395]